MTEARTDHDATDDASDESLYDAYLDAACRGSTEAPDAFLRRHGRDDPALLALLENVHRARVAPRDDLDPALDDGEDALVAGRRLGDYVLQRRLGSGAMGVVYEAEQRSLGRRVALKVLRTAFAQSATAFRRFEREARAIARLRSPNIVTVYDFGEAHGVRYIAMELVEGRGLDEVLADAAGAGTPLPLTTVLRWIADLARALDAAHTAGVVHRDVKPSNILVANDGRAMLVDFGVARDEQAGGATLTHDFIGSPAFVAPEQIGRGQFPVDGRADVYALGLVLYQCATGVMPFAEGTFEQVLHAVLTREPDPVRALARDVPRDVEVVIGAAIAKDPARRYASAGAFADDLEAIIDLRPIAARPPGPVERSVRWCRAHAPLAAGAGTAVLLGAAIIAVTAVSRIDAAQRRAQEAADALDAAAALVSAIEQDVRETRRLERAYDVLHEERLARYLTPEEDARLDAQDEALTRVRLERSARFGEAVRLLDRADDLGAERESVRRTRGLLYRARYREAVDRGDEVLQQTFLALARESDPELGHPGVGAIDVVTDPPGAEVHLFRRVSALDLPGGTERRLVSAPWRGNARVHEAETWALRVTRRAGPMARGDVILRVAGHPIRGTVLVARAPDAGPVHRFDRLEAIDDRAVTGPYDVDQHRRAASDGEHVYRFERRVATVEVRGASLRALGIETATPRAIAEAGGAPAEVWMHGARRDLVLPVGLDVRPTAAPLLLGDDSLAGRGPIEGIPVETGSYLLLVRADGYEDQRRPVLGGIGHEAITVTLLPAGTSPPGFVHLPRDDGSDRAECWIMEREVTMAEYLEYLNDLVALGESETARARAPRMNGRPFIERGDDGRYAALADYSRDIPAFGVTHGDALAYASWRTARLKREGYPFDLRLPTRAEWIAAAATMAHYVYGDRFRPKWFSSCFAHPAPDVEPVLRFPIDESALGVYDLTGSVSEWIDGWWRIETRQRYLKGGSWAHGGPEDRFRVEGGRGAEEDFCDGTTGFRLVARRESAP